MTHRYHAIYLSPHLDDAALSCGGQIHARAMAGEAILIVTITAGDPPQEAGRSAFADSLHQRWELATDATAARRAEDIEACRLLSADYLHWNLPDCIYRWDGERFPYASESEIFGAIAPSEYGLVEELTAQLRDLPPHDTVLAPLGVGAHVDHQLTRLAAERAFGDGLVYYEEYPYTAVAGAVEQTLAGASGWESETIPLQTANWERKIEAIAAYQSQLSTFFKDDEDIKRRVTGYGTAVGGERVWRKQTNLRENPL